MNLPAPKTKRNHYQARRAHADGWEVEYMFEGLWDTILNPSFMLNTEYRIVPDANGWIPFYATEDSVCPVEGVVVDLVCVYNDELTEAASMPSNQATWNKYSAITHYRPHKERKLIKTVKHFDDGTEEVCV